MRQEILLECTECKNQNYRTSRNAKGEKLDLTKFCRFCHKHTAHKERKK